jgi:hypothetical protein
MASPLGYDVAYRPGADIQLNLEEHIHLACQALGLHATIGFTVQLAGVPDIRSVAMVSGVGDENGMLIFRHWADVEPVADRVASLGYGYSVMDDPGSDEPFNLEAWKDVFLDWGWALPGGE